MRLTVIRNPSEAGATLGKLFIDGVFACWTLEDEVREVPGQPVSEWKIKGATAIPAGTYKVTLEHSNRFGPDTMTINDVPGFQYIRIHPGNTAQDTDGCLLLGLLGKTSEVFQSRVAVVMVRSHVSTALAAGQEVWIDISNAESVA